MIFSFKIGGLFSYKLKRGLAGRRQSCERVKEKIAKTDRVIWMHAASLGEYEQGLPVLEGLKNNFPNHKILITFFSPSGYEVVVKKKTIADAVCYLPFDLKKWVAEFSSHFHTDIFFTVKYDFWYNLLEHLKNKGARTYAVSALFYETQMYFKVYGDWFIQQLARHIDWFFHQNNHSTALAKEIGLANSSTSGDTRFDRVKQILHRDNSVDYIAEFKSGQQLLVFGSSWESEERMAEIIASKMHDLKIIIAPHDLKRVENLKKIFPESMKYSELEDLSQLPNLQVLIIDSIGILSRIYSYADVAVVGGGFHNKGLHNILEPAVFGIPVIFGNRYRKNPEADALVSQNGGKSFEDEFFAANYIISLLNNPHKMGEMGRNAASYVAMQPNATEIIVKKIIEYY